MSQTKEATEFLSRVAQLPPGPVSLDAALQPSLDDEAELRKLFATDKTNARLTDVHVGLVDVFAAPKDIRTTRARLVKDEADRSAHHVMPLSDARRRKEGTPAIVDDINAFKKNWSVFTESSLSQLLDWNNVVAAGGSVLACLAPLPASATVSKRAMRKHYHNKTYPSSDVDLFLWGLNAEEAENKINSIYEAVCDSVPWDVTCVRTKHTVSIHSQYPYRCVQIVLRLYKSPAEVLAGFDVDAPCFAYDGDRVWGTPRAIVAVMRQANTVDMTRRSPSYEVRLAKYSMRGFEVYIPNLRRGDVDPTIFERSINRIQGLARLLVLEKLPDSDSRTRYLQQRKALRGRPNEQNNYYYNRRRGRYNGDLKADIAFSGLEMNDYDVVSLHIPYGPGWDARRIEKLIFKTDLGLNSPYNPKNKDRRLHRHPAFFGTMEQCLDDCCGTCVEPQNGEEHKLQDEEDKVYLRGRIEFIADDPGRQSLSGSFNPIDEGEWSELAYTPPTVKFFNAIAMGDRVAVSQMLEDGENVNVRDHVGRTSLHVAILANNVDIATDLIDVGARMTARLVGGRSALHLAAQMGHTVIVKKMLERSALNDEKAKEEKAKAEAEAAAADVESDSDRPSSEDDWSSEESEDSRPRRRALASAARAQGEAQDDAEALEDKEDEPDILDLAAPDWDYAFTPLDYAIMAGSPEVVDVLLAAGADPKTPTKAKGGQSLHPLAVTLFTPDEDRAAKITERLLAAGAISSAADDNLLTIFHRLVCAGKTKVVASVLRHDPNAKTVVDFPAWAMYGLVYPVVSAIMMGDYATLAVLLAHDAQLVISQKSVSIAEDKKQNTYLPQVSDFHARVHMPLEAAMGQRDDVVRLLAVLGAEVDIPIKSSLNMHSTRITLLQWATKAIAHWNTKLPKETAEMAATLEFTGESWSEYRVYLAQTLGKSVKTTLSDDEVNRMTANRDYFVEVESLLRDHGAHGVQIAPTTTPPGPVYGEPQLQPHSFMQTQSGLPLSVPSRPLHQGMHMMSHQPAFSLLASIFRPSAAGASPQVFSPIQPLSSGYNRHTGPYSKNPVPMHLKVLYDELYEACWSGDNARIEELCLPKHESASQSPIQISVETATSPHGAWQLPYSAEGYTPLSIALHRRHWATARLVVAIATAQYKPAEQKMRFDVNELVHDDSDDEHGSDSEEDEEEAEVNFTDIAARVSSVVVDVPPNNMLERVSSTWLDQDKKPVSGHPLYLAIKTNNFEAFVNILDSYAAVGLSVWPGSALTWIMQEDRPEMLDEIVRRIGVGITVTVDAQPTEDGKKTNKTEERVYLGLDVGGKKRKDLVQKGAPSKVTSHSPNLIREAITAGAIKILDYLAGPRPVASLRYYASSHGDQRALYLRGIDETLEAIFPKQIGLEINPLNESPLTSAILSDRFEILQKLFDHKPHLMTTAMNARVKWIGFNGLLTAAYATPSTTIADFLLEKGCDPTERDVRGWNVYHLSVSSPNRKRCMFLDHLLKTLPKDLTRELLSQQSRDAFNTPLMLAVKRGYTTSVHSLLQFGIEKAVFLLKDANGSNVLHVAVQNSNADITRMLVEHGAAELLSAENGVGQTPLDIASQKDLSHLTRIGRTEVLKPHELEQSIDHIQNTQQPFILERQKEQIPKLRATLNVLLQDGQLKRGTKVATELLKFADSMEAKLANAIANKKAADISSADGKIDPYTGPANVFKTFHIIRQAVAARGGRRQLVHLLDVQRSVQRNLDRPEPHHLGYAYARTQRAKDEDQGKDQELDPEQKLEQQWKMQSMFTSTHYLRALNGLSMPYPPLDLFAPDML